MKKSLVELLSLMFATRYRSEFFLSPWNRPVAPQPHPHLRYTPEFPIISDGTCRSSILPHDPEEAGFRGLLGGRSERNRPSFLLGFLVGVPGFAQLAAGGSSADPCWTIRKRSWFCQVVVFLFRPSSSSIPSPPDGSPHPPNS
jgi:hypothetical protein